MGSRGIIIREQHMRDPASLLAKINTPTDLRRLAVDQLHQVASELRAATIATVAETGGHLGAGLGVIELTVALHYVYNTPEDLLVWDIGHQCYPHKILTGRKEQMLTLRKKDGISGFLKRDESVYDTFGAGHSSTSISAALGMAIASELQGHSKDVVAIIGDGAISAGMAYEAMNNAAQNNTRLLVILNDNNMSIGKPVGGMSSHLSRLVASKPFLKLYGLAKDMVAMLPKELGQMMHQVSKSARQFAMGNSVFEELGFHYIGPVDGHDVELLVSMLKGIQSDKSIAKPILLHVITEKGRGFPGTTSCEEKFHAVSQFDAQTGIQRKATAAAPSYTQIFAHALIAEAKADPKVVAITAAMPSGTGLDKFAALFPKRSFDVGIAEQHAVTFAAGLACEGLKPFVAIYSTFMQRAYDQVVHDVALQCLPVRFALDRAGFVGADGPTHNGSFDLGFMACLPNMVVMAPSDEAELMHMVATAASINDRPSCFRYPRGAATGIALPAKGEILDIGKGRIVAEYPVAKRGLRVALLSLGTRLEAAKIAAEQLFAESAVAHITVADARFAKPLDTELVAKLISEHDMLITIEEGAIGGFAAHVSQFLHSNGLLDKQKLFRSLFFPDKFLAQDSQNALNAEAGVDAQGIINCVRQVVCKPAHLSVVTA